MCGNINASFTLARISYVTSVNGPTKRKPALSEYSDPKYSCLKQFVILMMMCRGHMRSHEDRADVSHLTCTICGKKNATETSLAYHMKFHSADRLFKCDQCGKGTFHVPFSSIFRLI